MAFKIEPLTEVTHQQNGFKYMVSVNNNTKTGNAALSVRVENEFGGVFEEQSVIYSQENANTIVRETCNKARDVLVEQHRLQYLEKTLRLASEQMIAKQDPCTLP